jgi:hypothetical protein
MFFLPLPQDGARHLMSEFVHALAIVGIAFLPFALLLIWER